jgi:hypothetical protein
VSCWISWRININFTNVAELNWIFNKVNAGCFNVRLLDAERKHKEMECERWKLYCLLTVQYVCTESVLLTCIKPVEVSTCIWWTQTYSKVRNRNVSSSATFGIPTVMAVKVNISLRDAVWTNVLPPFPLYTPLQRKDGSFVWIFLDADEFLLKTLVRVKVGL